MSITRAQFPLGHLLTTPGVLGLAEDIAAEVHACLQRHASGDWGDLDDEDQVANDQALTDGGRLLSEYRIRGGRRVWVITEADRSATIILLPEEY